MATQKPSKEIIQIQEDIFNTNQRIIGIQESFKVLSQATLTLLDRVEKMRTEAKEKDTIARWADEIMSNLKIEPRKTIANMPYGATFHRVSSTSKDTFIKVRPTSYLLNSTLIQENLQRGNVLIMNTKSFTVFFVEASELVEILK